jgi:small subunit ribosomal protein S17
MPKTKTTTKENNDKKVKKILSGVVVSNKMQKTIVVSVTRFVKHPKYGKYYKISKKYKAHDENNKANIGDKVFLQETKPMSKDKKFIVVEN